MINYNDIDKAWVQRLNKEIWTKEELKNFGSECNGETVRTRFGIGRPERQQELDVRQAEKHSRFKQQKRIAAVKMGKTYDDLSQKGSTWSEVPPSPRAANEKLIWKSNLYAKNQTVRGQNGAIGRLGSYNVGDPEKLHRLDDKMKAAATTVTSPAAKTSVSFDVTQLLKRPSQHMRKPATLEPLQGGAAAQHEPIIIDMSYTKGRGGPLRKPQGIGGRRSSQGHRTMQVVMPAQLLNPATAHRRNQAMTKSNASCTNSHRSRTLQIAGARKTDGAKPRFNEDVDSEVKSIRENANQKVLKMNILNNRNRNNTDGLSLVSGSQKSAAMMSYISQSFSKHSIPCVNDKLSCKSNASSARFSALRKSQKDALHRRMSATALAEDQREWKNQSKAAENAGMTKREDSISQPHDEEIKQLEMAQTGSVEDGLAEILGSTKPVVKFDVDSASAVTYITDATSFNQCPSTINTVASSKLELQLNFLAKQLEIERIRREKLQKTVEIMAQKLDEVQQSGEEEVAKNETVRQVREQNVKRPNMDIDDLKVLNGGFVSIQ